MKFHITDENGETAVVEEIKEEKDVKATDDDTISTLSEEEIKTLKSLLPHVDKLIALVSKETDESEVEDEDKDEDEELDESIDADKEEIVDTDADEDDKDKDRMYDSMSTINKKTKANDSLDIQDEIAMSWAKRYNGGIE